MKFMKHCLSVGLSLAALSLPAAVSAQENTGSLDDLSLESLGNIVTSVSKKPEDSFRSPAAIYVITNQDIKLSGATHVAEVLRGVPGLNVSRIDSSNWAISSRGFGEFFANKLLVLVDGRTIYTPLFSGVYWDIQNLVLEDIERIEVIRGPGASLWGANAVNGVINIITKDSADTQGGYVSATAGNLDRALTDIRYGGKIGDGSDAHYRTYVKYENRNHTNTLSGGDGNNEWENTKAGFRTDWEVNPDRKITFQGDAYSADIELDLFPADVASPTGVSFLHDEIQSRGMNLLGRWEEQHDNDMRSTFQTYVDYQSPDYSALKQAITTFDFDYQTSYKLNDRNDLIWGGGARYTSAGLEGMNSISTDESDRTLSIISAFLQDQIAVIPKELFLTLGSKFEHHSFVGYVVEPSARVAWYPDNIQTLWAAVSRAVRTPSISEDSLTVNVLAAPPAMVQQRFSHSLDSEDLVAYEVGYRIKPLSTVSFDTTAFYNDYDNLVTFEPGPIEFSPAGDVFAPFVASNLGKAKTYGIEESVSWDVTPTWNLRANYSYINLLLEQDSTSLDPLFEGNEGKTPHHQASIRSQLFLPHDLQLINTIYYVDELPTFGVEDYVRLDAHLLWQPQPGLELSLVGQNLIEDHHSEFGAPLDGVQNEIPRSFYARVTFRY